MVRIVLAVVAVAVLGACADQPGGEEGPVAAGAELYATNCAVCHGPDLRGTGNGPPLLSELYVPSHHPDEAFAAAIRRGVAPHHWDFGPMPPIGGLDEEEVAAIIAYVRQQQEAAGVTD